jgi:hypothetical protein
VGADVGDRVGSGVDKGVGGGDSKAVVGVPVGTKGTVGTDVRDCVGEAEGADEG